MGMEGPHRPPCVHNPFAHPLHMPFSSLHYGIGFGLGVGETSQTSGAQGGSGGVGIRLPLPCLEGVQFGSVAGSQVVQAPVNVSALG